MDGDLEAIPSSEDDFDPVVDALHVMRALVEEGVEAFRLTREYVGEVNLPAVPGWSWFDWTGKATAALAVLPDDEDLEHEESNLVGHAERELRRAGLFDADSDYGGMLGAGCLAVVRVFASQGHSGFSAGITTQILERLLRFMPLTPLTSDPDEWMQVEMGDEPCWQSRRQSDAFSRDGGATYYVLDDRDTLITSERHDGP